MRVLVEKIETNQTSQNVVKLISEYGRFYAQWQGKGPTVENWYEVELDIPGDFTPGKDLFETESTAFEISQKNGQTLFTGELSQPDDDGISVMKIGTSVILLSLNGNFSEYPLFVRLSVACVCVSDCGI